RRYLSHIGVRPVDLAIDPATRVIDAIAAVSILLGVAGPLLLIGSWLDLAEASGYRLVRHRRPTAWVLGGVWLAAAAALTLFADLVLMIFVGPLVAVTLLARILSLDDELPAFLRITRLNPKRAFTGGLVGVMVFLTVLSTEALVIGPDFGSTGAEGWLVPGVLGFRAQPMGVVDVDGNRPPFDALYLGGNADLYVLVDPCDGDRV
ncbi:MAG: hypothetical protein GY743_20205, partial [Planctomycetaceae bacterium]|nr:hypothetical protein [Planctomycetaceae bacterium]